MEGLLFSFELDKLEAVLDAVDTEIDHEARISIIACLVAVADDLVKGLKEQVEKGIITS